MIDLGANLISGNVTDTEPHLILTRDNGVANFIFTGAGLNTDGVDRDFRIESNAQQNALFFDSTNDRIGFSGIVPDTNMYVDWGFSPDRYIYTYLNDLYYDAPLVEDNLDDWIYEGVDDESDAKNI